MAIGVWISLFAYFAIMIAIGIYAMQRSTSSSEDYMLGGRALSPKKFGCETSTRVAIMTSGTMV